jgi:formylmethanofuran dehydrogenase subunit E
MRPMRKRWSLKEAIDFHGHLGPYLVLGLKAGELALRRLKAKKYFGIKLSVKGAQNKPKSCLIDGLQLATGATYGKGNIKKFAGKTIKVAAKNVRTEHKIALTLKTNILQQLGAINTHKQSESFALQLYKMHPGSLFVVVKR